MRERLTVNMLMCLAQAGLQVIKDEVREQSLKAYIKTEDKLNFKNNAYLFLMKVGGADPQKMISQERSSLAKKKASLRGGGNNRLVKAYAGTPNINYDTEELKL